MWRLCAIQYGLAVRGCARTSIRVGTKVRLHQRCNSPACGCGEGPCERGESNLARHRGHSLLYGSGLFLLESVVGRTHEWTCFHMPQTHLFSECLIPVSYTHL